MLKPFGRKPTGNRLKRILKSPNYRDGAFHNLEPTFVTDKNYSFWKLLKGYMFKPDDFKPLAALPSAKPDFEMKDDSSIQITWFGHSSYLLQIGKFNILVDPVFSGYVSPVPIFGKSFHDVVYFDFSELPVIDLLIITHDHYDHLDHKTVTEIMPKVKKVVTPLGVGEHLEHWGYASWIIKELDWWEELEIYHELKITCTPSRHFSGRSIRRNQTLWASFVLEHHDKKVFIGGDSGYGTHFKEIGEKYGLFDLAILECGQYNEAWPLIHMFPEENLKALSDLKAETLFPVHWGKFALSLHSWNEPVKRLFKAAEGRNLQILTPLTGETIKIGEKSESKHWWL